MKTLSRQWSMRTRCCRAAEGQESHRSQPQAVFILLPSLVTNHSIDIVMRKKAVIRCNVKNRQTNKQTIILDAQEKFHTLKNLCELKSLF